MRIIGAQLEGFDEIVDFITDFQISFCKKHGFKYDEIKSRKKVIEIIKNNYKEEIDTYNWNNEEPLPVLLSERIFHETFSQLSKELYSIFLDSTYGNYDFCNLYLQNDINQELKELKEIYKSDGLVLDNKALISEMKQSLHYHLFEMYHDLKDILMNERDIQNISPANKQIENEMVNTLMQELKKMAKVKFQFDQMVTRIQDLNK